MRPSIFPHSHRIGKNPSGQDGKKCVHKNKFLHNLDKILSLCQLSRICRAGFHPA